MVNPNAGAAAAGQAPPPPANNPPQQMQQGQVVLPPGFSLGMVANTVESFSGKERVEEYFEKIEIRARLDNWDEKTTIDIIRLRLTGEAYRFFKTDPCLALPAISYADFKEKFVKRFAPIQVPGEALIKLGRCVQKHDESVSDYVTRLKSLGAIIAKEDALTASATEIAGMKKKTDEIVLHQFKAGIKREYMHNLGPLFMRTANLTIDLAEEFARQEELNNLMLKNRQHTGSILAITCYKCGQENHLANECRVRFQNQNRSNREWTDQNTRPPNFRPSFQRHPTNQRFNNFSRAPQNQSNRSTNYVRQAPRNTWQNNVRHPTDHHASPQNYNERNFSNRANPMNASSNQSTPTTSLNSASPPFVPRTGGN